MIRIVAECRPDEAEAQAKYLAVTPVAGLADHIRSRRLRVLRGIVESVQTLGQLKTEIGSIGRLTPRDGKFLVSELLPVLRANSDVEDGGLCAAIEALFEPVRLGNVSMNVTVLSANFDQVVKDGNKRTVAFYEITRESNVNEISFPVFVLVSIDRPWE